MLALFPNLPSYFIQTDAAVQRVAKFIEERGSADPRIRNSAESHLKVRRARGRALPACS